MKPRNLLIQWGEALDLADQKRVKLPKTKYFPKEESKLWIHMTLKSFWLLCQVKMSNFGHHICLGRGHAYTPLLICTYEEIHHLLYPNLCDF